MMLKRLPRTRACQWVGVIAVPLVAGCSGGGDEQQDSSRGGGTTMSSGGGATMSPGGATVNPAEEGSGGGGAGTGGEQSGTGGTSAPGTGGNSSLPITPLAEGCHPIPELTSRTVHEMSGNSQSSLTAALAVAHDGDVIVFKQSITGNSLKIENYDFDPENPLWVIAEDGVSIHSLQIKDSSGINVAGVDFHSTQSSTLLKVIASQHIKILRNSFDLSGVEGQAKGQSALILTPSYDVAENSEAVEIGCNLFENIHFDLVPDDPATADVNERRAHSGSFIKAQWDSDRGLIPTDLHIHHNHFRNIAPVPQGEDFNENTFEGDTDREAIVFGVSDSQDVQTNYVVESNLFEDCDGENEIITVKTSNNTIRNNTFKNSLGSVSIRFGAQTNVYGNYFLADGSNQHVFENDTGGVRIYGSGHLIFNNYFQGLTGTGYRMPILLDSGDSTDSSGGSKHERSSGVQVVHNTVVDCTSGIGLGGVNASYDEPPLNNTIANNLIVNTQSSLLVISAESGTVFDKNWGYGAELGASLAPAEFSVSDTLPLTSAGGFYVLSEASPGRDAGSISYESFVTRDIEGQTRSAPDIGADEYSTEPVTARALVADDVGPQAPLVTP